jgi:glucose-6-phosphate isomerase
VRGPAQPGPARALLGEIGALVERTRAAGLTEIVLLGSGPQARAAELLARSDLRDRATATRARRTPLTVLGGRDPAPLLRVSLDEDLLHRMLVVVTGADAGADALRRILAQALRDQGLSRAEVAERFVFLAEPGSALAAHAEKDGHTVIDGAGGQVFGALSPAALVPAALAGVDVAELLDLATSVLPSLTRPENNPGLVLGAILGGGARAGRDKLILGDFPARPTGLGAWIASLLTGATQGGLIPVVQHGGLPLAPADDLFQITLDGRPHQDDATVSGPLGAQLVVWEYAAAVAAYLLAADPFASLSRTGHGTGHAGTGQADTAHAEDRPADEPDDESPAFTVGSAMDGIDVHGDDKLLDSVEDLGGVLDLLIGAVPPDGFVTVMAYLDQDGAQGQGNGVRRLAALLAARSARPVTVEWGPFYPVFPNDGIEKGVFLILTGNVTHDAGVPDKRYRLSRLQLADALGDVRVLRERGRPIVRLHLHNRWTGIPHLLEAARGGA